MQFVVKSVPEINSVLAVGKKNRSVGATMMNQVGRTAGVATHRCLHHYAVVCMHARQAVSIEV